MEAIYDNRDRKFLVRFIDKDGLEIFHPSLFGMGEVYYGPIKGIALKVLAIELFLNFHKFKYAVPPRKIRVKREREQVSRGSLDREVFDPETGRFIRPKNMINTAVQAEEYYLHGFDLRKRKERIKARWFLKNGREKELFVNRGEFVTGENLQRLQLQIDGEEQEVVVPGYSGRSKIQARIVAFKGRHEIPCSLTNGGHLDMRYGPYEWIPYITHDGEAKPIPVHGVKTPEAQIEKLWLEQGKQWEYAAAWLWRTSINLNIPRQELIDVLWERTEFRTIHGFVEALNKLEAELSGLTPALELFKSLRNFFLRIARQEEVSLKDYLKGFQIIQKDATGSAWCLQRLRVNFLGQVSSVVVDPGGTGKFPTKDEKGKTAPLLKLYEQAWIDFSQEVRSQLQFLDF